jgi:hypothetical protein
VKISEKVNPSKCTTKTGRVGILASAKVDFKLKPIRREKEGQFILIKRIIMRK